MQSPLRAGRRPAADGNGGDAKPRRGTARVGSPAPNWSEPSVPGPTPLTCVAARQGDLPQFFCDAGARRATKRRPRSMRSPAAYAARGLQVVGVDVLENGRKAAAFRSEHRLELSRRRRHGSRYATSTDERAARPRLHRPKWESCERSWLASSRRRRCAPTSNRMLR